MFRMPASNAALARANLGTDQKHQPITPVFFLGLPEGMDKPLEHTPRGAVKMAANKGSTPRFPRNGLGIVPGRFASS
jgi:hypothetical protein